MPSSQQVTISPTRSWTRSASGPDTACYNWELLYSAPVTIAVHLSNNQRFAEAQKWFHLVFDPPSPGRPVLEVVRFPRQHLTNITTLLALLEHPRRPARRIPRCREEADSSRGYNAILANPFQPPCRRPDPAERLPVVRRHEIPRQPHRLGRQPVPRRHGRDAQRGDALLRPGRASMLGPRPQAMPPAGHAHRGTSCSSSKPAWTRWRTPW